MLMRIIAAMAVAGAATLLSPRGAQAEQGPQVVRFTLQNGMDCIVIPDHRAPVVTQMVWYRVGSADEEQGRSGLAHFLEHRMFKGTEKNPAGVFSKTLAAFGGQENAFTSNDYTAYYQRVSRDHLAEVMAFEADRMTGLVLNDKVVNSERDVVLEERRMRTDNSPAAQLGEEIQATLFVNHPYGRPVIGWEKEIEALNREQALAFYRRYYAPNNAILVIAGDVTPDEVKKLAEKIYGPIPRNDAIQPRHRPAEPVARADRRVVLADVRVAQPSLTRNYLAPSYHTAQPGEAEAIDVLAHVLGTGSLSRLYRKLVIEKKIAASAGAWYGGVAYDTTRLGISATPLPGVALEDLDKAIDGVIAEIVANGITAEELARAKTKLVADVVYSWDDPFTLARMYGAALTTGLSVETIQEWPDHIRAVTADQVQEAAKKWLASRHYVTGYLVKPPASPEKRS
ncbi:MAG TPA: pitrilysin family protein [Xanthobacteraceae bacterium]|nr:pitrilysin family protein [Xanthobacteraceae bacterium]